MQNEMNNGAGLLRLIGSMGICVALAWALQIFGFSGEGSAIGRFFWVVAAASVAGAGAGLIMASSLPQGGKRALSKV